MTYAIRYRTGRCADGAERDSGVLYHAIPKDKDGVQSWKAICGAAPGRRSAGWSWNEGPEVTCEKCKRAMLRQWIKETITPGTVTL